MSARFALSHLALARPGDAAPRRSGGLFAVLLIVVVAAAVFSIPALFG